MGVSGLLLDTHALVWWWRSSPLLPGPAQTTIETSPANVYVSAVAAWEMATKHRLGKWPEVRELLADFDVFASRSRLIGLPISLAHARLAGTPPSDNRDPFDRILAAQAISESLTLVSGDPAFLSFGLACVWRERQP